MVKARKFMLRAIELAENGRGICSPNPFVGAVIVKDGKIIGEGFTQTCGSDHAEIQALKNACGSCDGAEMYVTLEPCCHFGKTPPCTQAIINSGIRKVWIGIIDPNPLVYGKGLTELFNAGIEVQSGLLADKITTQLEYYLTYMTRKRPFVILKTAVSLDGRIAAENNTSKWITSEISRIKVHSLRNEVDVILTGIGTVRQDNPQLDVRLVPPKKQPVRIAIDPLLEIPLRSNLIVTAKKQKTILITSSQNAEHKKVISLQQKGAEIIFLQTDNGFFDVSEILQSLYRLNFSVIMIEAGSGINSAFLKAGLVDKLIVFVAPKLLGGQKPAWENLGISTLTEAVNLKNLQIEKIDGDLLITAYPDFPLSYWTPY